MVTINIPFEEIGKIKPRNIADGACERFTLGCETLDRDFADYEQYKEYIPPLGIKTIRLQGGWAKTEKVQGVYDFSWLDKIIYDAVGRGLNILLETDYGNPIYPGGGGYDLSGSFPSSDEALAAWDKWVEAMAVHYKGTVRDWAMWNEPANAKDATVESIVDFNIRTAKIIRRVIPDSRIAGLSLASSNDLFDAYVALIAERGELDLFDWFIYHGYEYNPDVATDKGTRLKHFLERRSDRIKLRQGENGCPSERAYRFAIGDNDWTELSQAKWDLRRYIGDIANGVDTAVFTICDFNHIGREINRKGILRAEADHKVVGKKIAYYAMQNMTSVFDDCLLPTFEKAAILFKRNCSVYPFSCADGNLLVYWDRSDTPGNATDTAPCQILFRDIAFDEPVLVDMISGKVFAIPADRISRQGDFIQFRDMPVIDSPFVIAEKRLLKLQK